MTTGLVQCPMLGPSRICSMPDTAAGLQGLPGPVPEAANIMPSRCQSNWLLILAHHCLGLARKTQLGPWSTSPFLPHMFLVLLQPH